MQENTIPWIIKAVSAVVGVLAQQIISILDNHGLDWHEYGFIYYDEWDATEYVTQMKKLITEERTRLEQLKESMYGVC